MMFTGKGVDVYRLMVMRSAVKLEAKGIRVSRGPKWTPVAKREFGLKRNATVEEIVAAITAKLGEVVPQAQAEGGIQQ